MNTFEKKLELIENKAVVRKMQPIEEFKLLQSENVAAEITLLKQMGLGNSIFVAEKAQEDILTRTSKSEEYDRKIVHISELKKLCETYRLYMQKADQYMGTIPHELGAEMLNYVREKNIIVSADSAHSRFYMVAPPKMFKTYLSPMDVLSRAVKFADEEREKRIKKRRAEIRARNEDPILLFQIPETPDYYVVLKSWGDDNSWLRRFYAMVTSKTAINLAFNALKVLLFGLFFYNVYYLFMGNKMDSLTTLELILGVVGTLSVLYAIIRVMSKSFKDFQNKLIELIVKRTDDIGHRISKA